MPSGPWPNLNWEQWLELKAYLERDHDFTPFPNGRSGCLACGKTPEAHPQPPADIVEAINKAAKHRDFFPQKDSDGNPNY